MKNKILITIFLSALLCSNLDEIRSEYNNGLYDGTFDQQAQGSFEFGKFDETNQDDIGISCALCKIVCLNENFKPTKIPDVIADKIV